MTRGGSKAEGSRRTAGTNTRNNNSGKKGHR